MEKNGRGKLLPPTLGASRSASGCDGSFRDEPIKRGVYVLPTSAVERGWS